MDLEKRGYMNRILTVDLTQEKFNTQSLDERVVYRLLGGKGLATWILYQMVKPDVNPLDPENVLALATGPLNGTIAPCQKLCIASKSPATGTINDSYMGGWIGGELKFSGYDAVVITGRAEHPSMLVVDDGNVSVKRCERLWGMNTSAAERKVIEELGEGFKVAVIGPAGERMSPIAPVFSNLRSAGRGGLGAVMGSKNLKAIAVRGFRGVKVHDESMFERMVWIALRTLRMNEVTVRSLPIYGTDNILLTINETGALPTRNFQTGRFEGAEMISGESYRSELWLKDFSCCLGCNIRCSKIMKAKRGGGEVYVDGPDYETIFSLGSNCGVSDKEAIAYANYLCDEYGIDTISVGVIIAFYMELYEKGYLKGEDLPVKPIFGDGEAMVKLAELIGKGEGVGKTLQMGVKRLAEKYPGSEKFAMHVKGLEMPGYEPRAAQGMGLCYAVSERGACHLRAYTAGVELCGYGGGADPLSHDRAKVQLAIDRQDEKAVVDSSVLCFFTLFGLKLKEVYQMVVSATGFEYKDPDELKKLGARIITLSRLFNVREGFSRKDDTLPYRCLEEPLPEGPARGQVVHLDEMLDEYYELRGWDHEGIPEKETVSKIGLKDII